MQITVHESLEGSASKTEDHEVQCLRLICNLGDLCSVTTTGISAYIWLEALARRRAANGALDDIAFAYALVMHDQVSALEDMCKNLDAARVALIDTEKPIDCSSDASYKSLIEAAFRIPDVVGLISTYDALVEKDGRKAGTVRKGCVRHQDVIQRVKQGFDELTDLYSGEPRKEIVGWKGCLRRVGPMFEQ